MNVIYCAQLKFSFSSPIFYISLLETAAKIIWKAFLARDKLDR